MCTVQLGAERAELGQGVCVAHRSVADISLSLSLSFATPFHPSPPFALGSYSPLFFPPSPSSSSPHSPYSYLGEVFLQVLPLVCVHNQGSIDPLSLAPARPSNTLLLLPINERDFLLRSLRPRKHLLRSQMALLYVCTLAWPQLPNWPTSVKKEEKKSLGNSLRLYQPYSRIVTLTYIHGCHG